MAAPCPTDKAAADGEVSPLTEPSCGGVSAAEVSSGRRTTAKNNGKKEAMEAAMK
eukprot:CAMPEP_0178506226 /NCGR_PEP_ID=MMETSP0696-20121128/19561_1 /TAXON_ID=265572 /ORGANISM="Extubocellulus spinifer, Strain CCMP396" /LENGTH=54 /DNA_ID=CAMNT_0020135609 /DNA_START=37 /DNA_END=198 /DNA_ORIENTATION=+